MPTKVESMGAIARIVLSGIFDFSTQADLSGAIDKALSIPGATEIQVDMSTVAFIDSSAIRALLQLQETARASGKSLSIWNCNAQIRETFSIGGFDQLFVIH